MFYSTSTKDIVVAVAWIIFSPASSCNFSLATFIASSIVPNTACTPQTIDKVRQSSTLSQAKKISLAGRYCDKAKANSTSPWATTAGISNTAAREAIENYKNAMIVENDEHEIYNKLKYIIENKITTFEEEKQTYDNTHIIEELEKLLKEE